MRYNLALPVCAPFVIVMVALGFVGYQVDLPPLYFSLGLYAKPVLLRGESRSANATAVLLVLGVVASVYCATITMLFYKSFIFAVP